MFEHVDPLSKRLLFNGLVALVTSNSGDGFHNSDQGHPAYRLGANGKIDLMQWGDSPDDNQLFKMMRELSVETRLDQGLDPLTWPEFCKLATDAYDSKKRIQS